MATLIQTPSTQRVGDVLFCGFVLQFSDTHWVHCLRAERHNVRSIFSRSTMQIIARSRPVTIPIGVIGRRQKQPRIQSCTLPMKPVDEVPAEHELQRELWGALAAPLVSSRALNPLHVALLRSNKTALREEMQRSHERSLEAAT